MFDSQSNSMICLNGLVLRRESLHSASNARFLLDSMFDFAERMNSLGLSDKEIGLFCAVVVIAPGKCKTSARRTHVKRQGSRRTSVRREAEPDHAQPMRIGIRTRRDAPRRDAMSNKQPRRGGACFKVFLLNGLRSYNALVIFTLTR